MVNNHLHIYDNVDNRLHELKDAHFMGEIQQIPPMYSAIRVQGKRLYESARKGEVVERQARSVQIDRFDLMREDESEQQVDFWVTCSKGTYIRSLAHDLGQAAGCGAHLVALRRECIGQYNVKDAWQMDDLIEAIQQQRKDG
jgi:tRNA pseudouridine55 synthase